jgi:hypothetical protein
MSTRGASFGSCGLRQCIASATEPAAQAPRTPVLYSDEPTCGAAQVVA